MTRPPIEQHMRVVACRWCGALAEECGGTCVNGTDGVQHWNGTPMKVKSREVWKWPEWQEFAARLGIPLTQKVTDCVVQLKAGDFARVSISYIAEGEPCEPESSTKSP